MNTPIKTLKQFFLISNAAFEMQKAILIAIGQDYNPSAMHELHKMALLELEKESPNLHLIDDLLIQMEGLAKSNNKP